MLIDRRSLFTLVAAAGLATKLSADQLVTDRTVRIRHQRADNMPLVWLCIGWTPHSPNHAYSTCASYTEEDLERMGPRVAADAEAYVRRRLTGPDRAQYLRHSYEQMSVRIPWRCADGSLNWDWETVGGTAGA